ncbi:Carbohydrate-binding module 48 (Isoamylase N-terminal domain) [Catalinimonas alkaloidigena]|uniref:Carbohydrate-binding module 48 (Isoamylase N-terminal domain) n=1 Tax=Catalinimonas alkaloidigena TaxID=1075417 RepID=A0A1G8WSL5_9BACT|nr:isoamylase early set domain-containing protein [Catalinimonas alkaloidigena]SDJ81037.1 Carbohydrate-binding module 48 (Isoamylase N-terminal domain) [Catalinimonas alkaloidigena]
MIKKKFLKSKPVCQTTFELAKETVTPEKKVFLVGDFNDWDKASTQMKPKKNGTFGVTLDLETGKEYQFRYLLGEDRWLNDEEADKYVASPFGEENSVISL